MIDLEKECRKYAEVVGGDADRIVAAFNYGVACGRLYETQIELAHVDRQIELLNRDQEAQS